MKRAYDIDAEEDESLRRRAARIAGVLAQRTTVLEAARVFHRIADELIATYTPERSSDA